jgi:hypothetical protein
MVAPVVVVKSKMDGMKSKTGGSWIVGVKVCMLWNPHGFRLGEEG